MTELLNNIETPSDAELISRVRGGDVAAYGDLFSRHVTAANRLARQLVRGPDADDLVSEAFAKVLSVLQGGGGPDVAFRAYLLTAVRRLHVDRVRAGSRLQTTGDMTAFDPGIPFQDTAVEGFESGAAAKAFASLPERWQLVLWHLEVEGQKPADIAPLLGMSANSVSALAYRAREGLRQAFLTMHLSDISEADCRWVNEHLGAYVRSGLSKRDTGKVQTHLEGCRRCTAMYLELTEVNSNLSGIIAPLLLGAAATGYVASSGGVSAAGLVSTVAGRVRDVVVGNATAATAGAVAAGVAAAAVVGISLTTGRAREHVVTADKPIAGAAPAVPKSFPAAPKTSKAPLAAATTPATRPVTPAAPWFAAASSDVPAPVVPAPDAPAAYAPTPVPLPGTGSQPGTSGGAPSGNGGSSGPPASNPGTSNPGTPDPGTANPGTTAPGTTAPGTGNGPGPSNPGTGNDPGTDSGSPPSSSPIQVDVALQVDKSGVQVHLAAAAGLPSYFDVQLQPADSGITFDKSPCSAAPTPTVTCVVPQSGGGSAFVRSNLAPGVAPTSFDVTLPFAPISASQQETDVTVLVTLPKGYESSDSSSNSSVFHYVPVMLPTVAIASLTESAHTVDTGGQDTYTVSTRVTGAPSATTPIKLYVTETLPAADVEFGVQPSSGPCSGSGASISCIGLSADSTVDVVLTMTDDAATKAHLAVGASPAYLASADDAALSLQPGLNLGLKLPAQPISEDPDNTFRLDAAITGLESAVPAIRSVVLRLPDGAVVFENNDYCHGDAHVETCTLEQGLVHPTLKYTGDIAATSSLTVDVPEPYIDLDQQAPNEGVLTLVPAGVVMPPTAAATITVPQSVSAIAGTSFDVPVTVSGLPAGYEGGGTFAVSDGTVTATGCTSTGLTAACPSLPTEVILHVTGATVGGTLTITLSGLDGYGNPTSPIQASTLLRGPFTIVSAAFGQSSQNTAPLTVLTTGGAPGSPVTLSIKSTDESVYFLTSHDCTVPEGHSATATCTLNGQDGTFRFEVKLPQGQEKKATTLYVGDSADGTPVAPYQPTEDGEPANSTSMSPLLR